MSSFVPALAEPLPLGRVRLRNRFVSAPMERNYCELDGTMTDRYVEHLVRRARGGAALVFTEASYVRADGKGRRRQMGVDVDERIPGIARLAEAVHAEGALLGVELNHGGRTAQGAVSGYAPVAPSAIPCAVAGGELPQVLATVEIHDLVQCYADAAARCAVAGVDVVSLHGGHGYLIHQFLSPAYNHRDDEFAEPTRFLELVLAAVREAAPELTVGLRFSAFEGIPGGLDAAATLELIGSLDPTTLDFLDVSAGNYEAGQWIIQPGEWERGLLAPFAEPYRALGLPVGVAGRINTPEAAEAIVAGGRADFVSLARTLHADPDFPNRALRGERYRPCIACNHCIDSLGSGEPIPCTVNPWVGREAAEPVPAALPSEVSVQVIGAGPAGLAAARELARAGATVEVHDARPGPGGDFALAARVHEYPEYGRLVDWYEAELRELGVRLRLGASVTPATVAGWQAVDAVVLATGGQGPRFDLPGAGDREVLDVREWLASGRAAPPSVVVYGADRDGSAVADDLAARGSTVTLIGPQSTPAADVGRRAKILLVPRLLDHPRVRVHLDATLVAADGERLAIRRAAGQGAAEEWLDAPGPVLVSRGVEPRRDLLDACRALDPPLGVHAVGDAGGNGGSVHAVTATAVAAARRIAERGGPAASSPAPSPTSPSRTAG